jgi:hypothetical protein
MNIIYTDMPVGVNTCVIWFWVAMEEVHNEELHNLYSSPNIIRQIK